MSCFDETGSEAQQPANALRHESEDWFLRIEEALPTDLRDLRRERLVLPTVEGVIAVPERLPGSEIILLDRTYEHGMGMLAEVSSKQKRLG